MATPQNSSDACPTCNGVGATGSPGRPCQTCGGTGQKPQWLQNLARARKELDRGGIEPPSPCGAEEPQL